MTPLVVPTSVLDALAQAQGLAAEDGDGYRLLRSGQRSKRMVLLGELVRTAMDRQPDRCRQAGVAEAFTVLGDAQRRGGRLVDEVLLEPHVGAWATGALRSLRLDDRITDAALGRLGALAAAAVLRAGIRCAVTAHPADGLILLPTFGGLYVPSDTGWCRLHADGDAGTIELVAGSGQPATIDVTGPAVPGWSPVRHLHAHHRGRALDLRLDDLDPDRGCGPLPVTHRLTEHEVRGWQQLLDQAWLILVSEQPPVADAVANLVTSVVPLVPSTDVPELSASHYESIGAVSATRPRTAHNLALALAHELHHTTLCMLLDVVPLLTPRPGELFYAPWRRDPRPLPGLLQGTYAWLGLAGHWAVGASSGEVAGFELALARLQIGRGLRQLADDPTRLTPAGRHFVQAMRRRLATLDKIPVAARPRQLAASAAADHEACWRRRNRRPGADVRGPLPSEARLAALRRRLGEG